MPRLYLCGDQLVQELAKLVEDDEIGMKKTVGNLSETSMRLTFSGVLASSTVEKNRTRL